jgi:hypothetical protein
VKSLAVCSILHRLAPIASPFLVSRLLDFSFGAVCATFASFFFIAFLISLTLSVETAGGALQEDAEEEEEEQAQGTQGAGRGGSGSGMNKAGKVGEGGKGQRPVHQSCLRWSMNAMLRFARIPGLGGLGKGGDAGNA